MTRRNDGTNDGSEWREDSYRQSDGLMGGTEGEEEAEEEEAEEEEEEEGESALKDEIDKRGKR